MCDKEDFKIDSADHSHEDPSSEICNKAVLNITLDEIKEKVIDLHFGT